MGKCVDKWVGIELESLVAKYMVGCMDVWADG